MKTDVLIYVEDPGAANYVAGLPGALVSRGITATLLAAGHAVEYLRGRGVEVETFHEGASAVEILSAFSPRLLVVGTSENEDTIGLRLVEAARSLGIRSAAVVDALSNSAYRFRGKGKDPLGFAPDLLFLPDRLTKDTYVSLGYPGANAVVCGHPHYDEVLDAAERLANMDRAALRSALFPGAAESGTVIVFVSEVSTGLNEAQYRRSADYTLTGRGKSEGRTEIVIEEFLDAVRLMKQRPTLVLRLHPKNTSEEFSGYLREFDQVSGEGDPLALVYAADLAVGMSSMLLMEAAVMGRPTLSILPRASERDWLPSIRMGLTRCVTSREELRSALRDEIDSLLGPRVSAGEDIVAGSLMRTSDLIAGLLESPLAATDDGDKV